MSMANHGYCYKCMHFEPLKTGVGLCQMSLLYNDKIIEVREDSYCPDYKRAKKKREFYLQ